MHRIIRVNFLHRLGFSAGPQSAWTLLQLLLLSPPLVFEYPVLPPITTPRETPRVPAPLVLPAPSPPAQTSTQGSTFIPQEETYAWTCWSNALQKARHDKGSKGWCCPHLEQW